jgi:hypothetical protein
MPRGEPDSVEDVGEVRLEPVPEAMRAGVRGKLLLNGGVGASGVRVRLITRLGPANTTARPHGADDHVDVTAEASGGFAATGLSPMEYSLRFEAPGFASQDRLITLKPGETLDLGTIRLERPKRIAVSYRVAPSPPFTQAPPERQIVLGGGQFKAENAIQSASDLRFDQSEQKIRFVI